MNTIEWANKYKKRIAREFIRRIAYESSAEPSGIFTAGLPGAGKTEFTEELIKNIEHPPLRIDMDEIARLIEGYKPEIADKFKAGASIILSRIYDEVLKAHIDFVFDGTFSSPNALPNLQRAIRHGHKVKVYYIHQDPVIAWQFTKDRELVEHRAIDRMGFIETYGKIENNLRDLCKVSNDVTISLIVKDSNNRIGQRYENVDDKLFDLLPKFLTKEQLGAVIV